MSKAFEKEDEPRWLNEIPGSMRALLVFLTNEYDRPVFVKRSYYNEARDTEFHVMSDGLTYFVDGAGRWDTLKE
ncbi:MAG: hypothetical protein V4615_08410 [Bacteroidota bacterium]